MHKCDDLGVFSRNFAGSKSIFYCTYSDSAVTKTW